MTFTAVGFVGLDFFWALQKSLEFIQRGWSMAHGCLMFLYSLWNQEHSDTLCTTEHIK